MSVGRSVGERDGRRTLDAVRCIGSPLYGALNPVMVCKIVLREENLNISVDISE